MAVRHGPRAGGGSVTAELLAPRLVDGPGVYNLAEADYHQDPMRHLGGSLSSTTARKILPPSCPALARHAATHPEYKDAYDLGSVTHRLILGAGCEIVEVPADTWGTNAAKHARTAARERGAVALLSKDLRAAYAMRAAVLADDLARALLGMPGRPEQTLIWQEAGTWCRALLDRWPDPTTDLPVIVDLKTSDAVDDAALAKSCWSYGYHQQEDWYRRGYRAVHGVEADFWFVFVTKDPPHLVRCVQLDDPMRREGATRNAEALDVWRACVASGDWPAYEPTALIGPPRWARTREDS